MQLKPLDVAATVRLLKTKCQKNSARFLDQTEKPHTHKFGVVDTEPLNIRWLQLTQQQQSANLKTRQITTQ